MEVRFVSKWKEDGQQVYFTVCLLCDTEILPKGWEISVDVTFFIYDHTCQTYATIQDAYKNTTKLHEKKTEWGFEKLMTVRFFKDSKNGFLLNDSCVFGAEVFVVPAYATKDRCLTMIKPPSYMNTHTWKIDNFSAVTDDELQSEIFKIGKLKWKLSLYPKGLKDGLGTHISLFLGVHDASSFPNDWRVYADFTLRLKSQNRNVDTEREIRHWFCPSDDNRGVPSFIELSELTNAANGYLLNDTLIVEVEISSHLANAIPGWMWLIGESIEGSLTL
ncbi:uncharacterized protein [Rutidosis leptorrhynchoides]|uniref:uncharacterized protein n=1 Tax=Rutidosis leptorrhynchoides TaxID=125765 RepID=UPI003A9920B7